MAGTAHLALSGPRPGDPTCFASLGLENEIALRMSCCGRDSPDECFDETWTRERCCGQAVARATGHFGTFLIMGMQVTERLFQYAGHCWPGASLPHEAWEGCCGMRRGMHGRRACFNGTGLNFVSCCLPVILEGLDRCNPEADPTCAAGFWEPFNIAGFDSRRMTLNHRLAFGQVITKWEEWSPAAAAAAAAGASRGHLPWDDIGRVQFSFLAHPRGGAITPSSGVLDIGCGSLRLGRWLVPFLDAERYFGVDKSWRLIEQGYWIELLREDRTLKRPLFLASQDFEFALFKSHRRPLPDVSFANSLITHLVPKDVRRLLSRLRDHVRAGHAFFATYVEPPEAYAHPSSSSAVAVARYVLADLAELGRGTGWSVDSATDVWHECQQAAFGVSSWQRHLMARFTAV